MIPDKVSSTDGIEIHLHDLAGSAELPLLVLSHATGFHGRVWEPVAARLADKFHCVSFDYRGHGKSQAAPDAPFETFSWHKMTDDLLAVIDSLSTGPVLAAGWSMGGATVIGAQFRRPGVVDAGFLFEPVTFPSEVFYAHPAPNPIAENARRRRPTFESRAAVAERYGSRPPFDGCSTEGLAAYVDYGFADTQDGQVTLRCRPAVEGMVFDNWLTGNFGDLADLSGEYLIVGSDDMDGPGAVAELVADKIPGASFAKLTRLTHFAPLEDPERVASEIRRFFDGR